MEERETERRKEEEREGNGRKLPEEGRVEDVEKGEKLGVLPQEQVMERDNPGDLHVAMLHRLNPTNPLRVIINGGGRVATPSPRPPSAGPSGHLHQSPVPRSISTPQVNISLPLDFTRTNYARKYIPTGALACNNLVHKL